VAGPVSQVSEVVVIFTRALRTDEYPLWARMRVLLRERGLHTDHVAWLSTTTLERLSRSTRTLGREWHSGSISRRVSTMAAALPRRYLHTRPIDSLTRYSEECARGATAAQSLR
jgi:hypothetical protein